MSFQQWADAKDPEAVLEYWLEWGPQLGGAGIAAGVNNPLIEPDAASGLVVTTFENIGTRTFARFSGGSAGVWAVKFTLDADDGQTYVHRVEMTVAET